MNKMIHVRLEQEVIDALDKMKKETFRKKTDIIREMIVNNLKEKGYLKYENV